MSPSERSPAPTTPPPTPGQELGDAGTADAGTADAGASLPISRARLLTTRGLVGAAVVALIALQFIPVPAPTSADLVFLATDLSRATLSRAAFSVRTGTIASDSALFEAGALGSPYTTLEESVIRRTPPSWRTRMSNSRYVCEQEGQLSGTAPLVRPIICRVNDAETVWGGLPASIVPAWLVDHRRWRVEPVTESAEVAFVITADSLTPPWRPLSLGWPAPAQDALGGAGIPP